MAVVLVLNRERHAAAMTRWSVHFARGLDERLYIVSAKAGAETFKSSQTDEGSQWDEVKAALLDLGLTANRSTDDEATSSQIPVTTRKIADRTRQEAVLHYLDEKQGTLLVIGKQLSERSSQSEQGRLARELFDTAPCSTLLLRLGNHDGSHCQSLLVPTRNGEQAGAAMRLGYALSRHHEAAMGAITVEPPVGPDARALGQAVLKRALKRGKVGEEDPRVTRKVVLANDVSRAIADEAEAGKVDLLLLGSGKGVGLRKRLFGTVPDNLFKRPGGMAVAVVRDALPAGQVIGGRFERWLSHYLMPLGRDQRLEMFEKLQVGSSLSLDFVVLIALSTLIAALGLVQGSTAVVIGAMLVAPLMTPLLGAGLGLVQGNVPMIRSSARSITVGFFIAFIVGCSIGLVTFPWLGNQLVNEWVSHVLNPNAPMGRASELISRTQPGILDLAVAFISGIAASFCLARPGLSSALAGVAIAAALVPPIATAGIALAYVGWVASGLAALLFTTNVVAIILGSSLTFYLIGIRGIGEPKAVLGRRIMLALLLGFIVLSLLFTESLPHNA
jgi:uncharacterized hydrophobic protein (TIGR00271 family)